MPSALVFSCLCACIIGVAVLIKVAFAKPSKPPRGLFCGCETDSVFVVKHSVNIAIDFAEEDLTFGYEVTGDTVLPSCTGVHYIHRKNSRKLLIDESAPRPACFAEFEKDNELRYKGNKVLGKHPVVGDFVVLPTVLWDEAADTIDVTIESVTMIGKDVFRLSKSCCPKDKVIEKNSEL
eukprot:CAMPEP_0177503566 /NCGR_PEP_ID=MMETSP0369-20130122/38379_1 /TAXON_ID=447022 ORGANISM="Scrippsiella hangoei-like, Strain SHHI-4" /NCGR_SAMPLE_ID=MMETSP0369 /ASSEMBLY_ACC=CAM_ASM_000364 /LENGTH=178 /DNA_ID=CAMNT_0018981253 /DNA_START=53 /DNA_END=589 /DNA_ORIENTATION=-